MLVKPNMQTAIVTLALILPGCGLYVPEQNIGLSSEPSSPGKPTSEGLYEVDAIQHIKCEIGNALSKASKLPHSGWLSGWGTSVDIKLSVDETGNINPGLALKHPFQNFVTVFPKNGNVTTPQNFNMSLGFNGSSHITRLEEISFTYGNKDLIKEANLIASQHPNVEHPCDDLQNGLVVQGDLKIDEFIYNKVIIATTGVQTNSDNPSAPPFQTWSETLTFASSFGGSANPVWTLAPYTFSSGNNPLVSATRSHTNTLLLTLSALKGKTSPNGTATLSDEGQAVHQAARIGIATGGSTQAQIP